MTASAGGSQRGHDFLANQARLAHAGYNDTPPALDHRLDGATKFFVDPFGQLVQGPCFQPYNFGGILQLIFPVEALPLR